MNDERAERTGRSAAARRRIRRGRRVGCAGTERRHRDETRNELRHGADQTHDLAVRPGPVADADWYQVYQYRDASYEVVVDRPRATRSAASARAHRRRRHHRAPESPGNAARAAGPALDNTGASDSPTERVRVAGAAAGTACGADDVYSIRVRETTVYVPRFNNSGTQGTVLLLQGAPAHGAVDVRCVFRTAGGTLARTRSDADPVRARLVSSTCRRIRSSRDQSGHVIIGHNGGYGGLVAKGVAIEPATGFTFDTPGVPFPTEDAAAPFFGGA